MFHNDVLLVVGERHVRGRRWPSTLRRPFFEYGEPGLRPLDLGRVLLGRQRARRPLPAYAHELERRARLPAAQVDARVGQRRGQCAAVQERFPAEQGVQRGGHAVAPGCIGDGPGRRRRLGGPCAGNRLSTSRTILAWQPRCAAMQGGLHPVPDSNPISTRSRSAGVGLGSRHTACTTARSSGVGVQADPASKCTPSGAICLESPSGTAGGGRRACDHRRTVLRCATSDPHRHGLPRTVSALAKCVATR